MKLAWAVSVILACGGLRQENHGKFEASLDYGGKLCLKQKQKERER